jgi:zinc transporter ZupT
MIFYAVVLFLAAFLGGYSVIFFGFSGNSIRLPLVFAGAYLFTITIIHILPELYSLSTNPFRIGLFVLLGFFFQRLLEYFTSGIEHGHVHVTEKSTNKFFLLIALLIHSLLEGSLLTHQSPFHGHMDSNSLLLGIVLHKAPAGFALMAIFKDKAGFSLIGYLVLILFSLASPAGLLMSNLFIEMQTENLYLLFALVSGGFLHISTTIFVESSPEHRFGWIQFLVTLSGAGIAIISEYFF